MSMVETIWVQREIVLRPRARGIHLITDEFVTGLPEIATIGRGLAHLFLLHTSAALALNESVEPEVRQDLERYLDTLAPDSRSLYAHAYEGPDDMPAHIKGVLIGAQLTLPISQGALKLGAWQGVYLCEFRNRGGARRVFVTLNGTSRSEQFGD
jgi:secondary thiamine-phosphate synthase enzyme